MGAHLSRQWGAGWLRPLSNMRKVYWKAISQGWQDDFPNSNSRFRCGERALARASDSLDT